MHAGRRGTNTRRELHDLRNTDRISKLQREYLQVERVGSGDGLHVV
jgi:hypothetical protein